MQGCMWCSQQSRSRNGNQQGDKVGAVLRRTRLNATCIPNRTSDKCGRCGFPTAPVLNEHLPRSGRCGFLTAPVISAVGAVLRRTRPNATCIPNRTGDNPVPVGAVLRRTRLGECHTAFIPLIHATCIPNRTGDNRGERLFTPVR